MSLNTIGLIATHIAENFVLPVGVSGNLVETVDCARIDVQNYTGNNIGSNSIDERYQSAIKNLSIANALDSSFMWAATFSASGTANVGGGITAGQDVKLGELSVSDSDSTQEADAFKALSSLGQGITTSYRDMYMMALKSLGRKIQFARSLS